MTINHENPQYRSDALWRSLIRAVPDFPQDGILFQDVVPLLGNRIAFGRAIGAMHEPYACANIDQIVGLDARGFIFGAALSEQMYCGFTPVRKAGKLPGNNHRIDYGLEYGKATFELPVGSVKGQRCLIVDDVLVTGGTAAAACELVKKDGGIIVGVVFMIELTDKRFKGREKIRSVVGDDVDIFALLDY